MAVQAGWTAMQRTWAEGVWLQTPLDSTPTERSRQAAMYRAWYSNTIFESISAWTEYRQRLGLYRNVRPVYNPVRRLVDFYAAAVYPGMLSEDGATLPQGIPNAIPLAEDTAPALKTAIAQAWQWGAWQSRKAQLVRRAATYGDLLVELADDVDRGKVYPRLIGSDRVAALTLDEQGAVKGYTLEYYYWEESRQHLYTKVVTRDAVQTFRDERPFGYGTYPAAYALPYGFVPAVWVRQKEDEGDRGLPAADGSLNKIAYLMALASHVHDQVHKAVGAPVMIFSDGDVGTLDDPPDPATDEAAQYADESIPWLKGPAGGSVASLLGNLPLDQALTLMQDLQNEIERDHPPLRVWEQLRAMSQVTGPAANRLLGDAAAPLLEAEAVYDQRMQQILQMTVAIGGLRAAEGLGGWAARTRQQAKFAPFDLASYAAGELDFAILPRPLIAPTFAELLGDKAQEYAVIKAARDAGIPLKIALQRAQWSETDIAAVLRENEANAPQITPAPPRQLPPGMPQEMPQ